MIKRFNPDFSLSISHELAYMRETPEGGYVAHGDYATLFSELELVKAERDALAVENAALKTAHPQPFGREMMKALDAYEKHQDEVPETGMLDAFFILRDSIRVETPATDAALAAIRDKYRAEGIIFAANRLLAAFEHGFIDKPAGEVVDVAKMILSAVTELPDAPEDDFTRDYSDEVIALIRAELSGVK